MIERLAFALAGKDVGAILRQCGQDRHGAIAERLPVRPAHLHTYAGTIHIRPSKSISDQRALSTSAERAAVKSEFQTAGGDAIDAPQLAHEVGNRR